ncbi:hypothetical protein HCB45_14050 [Listeria sp. FSL L7-0091]|uniref:Uncharacterized protein n=1 Tax=Listeria farberi TaxID=2713500 RepID=A0A7X0ZFJ7_9LIST|nr:hypothetical protein [Listeria farberi]MBC1374856.1 hypothetical protein [Listeria farberi]MBC1380556.1 hypothetical protein [Listeria farberi]MBC2262682.1 hypothetical protein [Listeria farberi]MBC2266789.1 hypothetical protein [Listeria farberi]MBC2286243.1 hypothetical protein [Listeria farberi]
MLDTLRKAVEKGDTNDGFVLVSQIAALITEIKPCKEIFEEIIYVDIKRNLL